MRNELVSILATQTPTDSPASGESEAADVAMDILTIGAGVVVGALAGIVIAIVAKLVIRFIVRHNQPLLDAAHPAVTPMRYAMAAIGAWAGLGVVTQSDAPSWKPIATHVLLILIIVAVTWFIAAFATGMNDAVLNHVEESGHTRRRKIQTQLQILNRVILVMIWGLGAGAVLMSFDFARTLGASLFASAGLISVVAGIAAQSTLGNFFAGLQLAFSDSIRMGDIVIWQQEYTSVEDITLTYVVLKVWDGRRLIVPSKELTTQTFENWTRSTPEMLGYVDFMLDWSVPVKEMRAELDRILAGTDLWDGRRGIIQVRATEGTTVQVSALVSAQNPSKLTDLKTYVRERLLRWIQAEAPGAMPHNRSMAMSPLGEDDQLGEDTQPTSEDSEQDAATSPTSTSSGSKPQSARASRADVGTSPVEASPHAASGAVPADDAGVSGVAGPASGAASGKQKKGAASGRTKGAVPRRTPLADRDDLSAAPEGVDESGYESSIFTGSVEAEQLAAEFSGPGEDAIRERAESLKRRTADHSSGESEDADASEGPAATQVLPKAK